MAYSNSPLATVTVLSPNNSGQRNHAIDTITIHMVWGQFSAKEIGNMFLPTSRQASSNYGIGKDGEIGLYVEEKNRAWTSGSRENDNRAITIEVSNDRTEPMAVNNKAYASLINLCADICKRNGKTKMIWLDSLSKANAYKYASNEMRMTLHRWFQNTSCPGTWLTKHMEEIANKVNAILNPEPGPSPTPAPTEFKVGDKVTIANGAIVGGLSSTRGKKIDPKYTGGWVGTISKIETHKGVDEALIKEISTWTSLIYLSHADATPQKVATTKPDKKDASLAGYYYTKGNLNIRNGAGTNYSVMTTIPLNTKVYCDGSYSLDAGGTKWFYLEFTFKDVNYKGFGYSVYLRK